ncbi:MAG: hypothetical protein KDK99_17930 [Verrucomicrobiales bacterium]|nr:hypothetical protein [Verrucomicrobiales bacterium]
MENEDAPSEQDELTSRAPTEQDLIALCRTLNALSARYMIVGGFAVIYSGYARTTTDLDLLMSVDPENEAKVYQALALLPDQAVLELEPGEVAQYTVVRVADEITVDLMKSASGIDYEEASKDIVIRRVQDVDIPFASPRLLWRMKKNTHREKDLADLLFLRQHYPEVTGE